ncbi:hypothetical protein ACQEVG_06120 [Streptomyces sp. CA-135486]|uniref:hypothetical protein n=1 Tax=Streptomyces sp. CA-135486 TaxID=3240049 RepID=UPI003D92739A
MSGRGCGGAVLFTVAALFAYASIMSTIEMETFPGLRDNDAGLALFFVVLAAGAAVAGLFFAGRRSRAALVATACVAVALTWRAYTVAPAMHCWDHNSVGRNDDGSYDCYDR